MSDTPKMPPGYMAVRFTQNAGQCCSCAGDKDFDLCDDFVCCKDRKRYVLVKIDLRHFVTEATK